MIRKKNTQKSFILLFVSESYLELFLIENKGSYYLDENKQIKNTFFQVIYYKCII